ncbi:hypothetical protein [Chitinophaga caseinilytica]|uniref:hypothetical protein n=1 Tax=Chitinophaga caseinilytica TaxID=2267521 RepID=UPI003C2C0353
MLFAIISTFSTGLAIIGPVCATGVLAAGAFLVLGAGTGTAFTVTAFTDFLTGAFATTAGFLATGAGLTAVFFTGAAAFLATAAGFLAGTAFLEEVAFEVVTFTAGFLAAAFFGAGFTTFAAGFFAAAFFGAAAGFFLAGAALAAAFLGAAAFFATAFFAGAAFLIVLPATFFFVAMGLAFFVN